MTPSTHHTHQPRAPWPDDFPGVVIHAGESSVKQHPRYPVAKAGDGFSRLARQAAFAGDVVPGFDYIIVDDFVGQGGTLANLRGFIESQGGKVIATTVLTGKPYSAILPPTREQLQLLRSKHGAELEKWWQARFGHAFDCLTQSEARYLERTADADTVRNRITAAEQAGDCRAGTDVP